jgi:hypothetical protein
VCLRLQTMLTLRRYEIPVLKVFAEPLLNAVAASSSHYAHACQLLQLLSLFNPMSPAKVPHTRCDDAAAAAAASGGGGGSGGGDDGDDDCDGNDDDFCCSLLREFIGDGAFDCH